MTDFSLEGQDDKVCMRPLLLTERQSTEGILRFLVATSNSDQPREMPAACHPCGGVIGLFVVSTKSGTHRLVSALPDIDIGTWGEAPAAEQIALVQIGSKSNWAWIVESGYGGQGVVVSSYNIFGGTPPLLKQLGTVPAGYSDQANCENGKELDGGQPCSDFQFSIGFEKSASSYWPVVLQGSGVKLGKPYRERFRIAFDEAKQEYPTPPDINP